MNCTATFSAGVTLYSREVIVANSSRISLWSDLSSMSTFNDIAKHDIGWGNRGVDYINDYEPTRSVDREGYLLLGLSYLHRLVTAPTFDARYDLLDKELPHHTVSFFDALSYSPQDDRVTFALENPEARASFLEHPHAADRDNGPKDAWTWAHEDAYPSALCNDIYRSNVYMRQCGYVMWDRSRWDPWRLLDIPYEWLDSHYQWEYSQNRDDSKGHHAQMQYSFRRRSSIWRCGGRRWWAPGDESKVVWPEGRPPKGWLPEEEWWKKKQAETEGDERRKQKEAVRSAHGLTDLEELLLANR